MSFNIYGWLSLYVGERSLLVTSCLSEQVCWVGR